MILILKILSIFLGLFMLFATLTRIHYKQHIPSGNFFWLSISITVFVALQWLL